ncbi:transposase DDE domain protein [Candidatus Methanoplasma termitum]|uniref:Transposase DDE domain protein n=1 Tax=Candidatus Methanoplasma termitum TaxID=1577791 RepID=A0A0A7LCC5_9ARCH|nr:IS5-like element ISMte1 family transposase [Candidatus Methanoplasma termitum]AIZ56719.1 transposase DDE domain protein [Candidatus Methanoplasma termitum]AIZ56730.1 transposase DDE domain protein [Candidatus Methanoplasma termitum]AIZ57079.1 transposase DDE domain protein [Candidatus Methanoplasma termitum]
MAEMGWDRQYNRHWDEYNQRLVERGRIFWDLSWVPKHLDEIGSNEKKRGRPRLYGDALISYVSRVRTVTGIPFRMLEGLFKPVFDLIGIEVPSYPTLWRRCTSLEAAAGIKATARKRIVAVDSTGIKVTVRGGWMREKWKVHKGWLKLHILSDVETNEILAFVATDERSSDAKHLLALVDAALAAGHGIAKVLADGAYDTRKNWNGMRERKIEFIAHIRKNASTTSRGCTVRSAHVRERNAIGEDEWRKRYGYNMRWKVESVFSDLKRMFGESVSSKTFENMVAEISRSIECFNMMKAAGM